MVRGGAQRPVLHVNELKKTGARYTRALRFVVCVFVSADGSWGGGAKNINCINRKYKADLSCSPRPFSLREDDTTPEEGKVLNVSINLLLN
jgi:hypothetical protein